MENRDWDAETADALTDEPFELSEEEYRLLAEPPAPPLHVVVVGSVDWPDPLVVQAVLLGWAQRHQDRGVLLWTTNAPEGAEQVARAFGNSNGWSVSMVGPDQLSQMDSAVTFAFLTEGSTGAAGLVEDIAVFRPVQVFTTEVRKPRSRWQNW